MIMKRSANWAVTTSLLAGVLILTACGDRNRNDMADGMGTSSADSLALRGDQAGMLATDSGVNPGVAAGGMGPDGRGMAGAGGRGPDNAGVRLNDAQILNVAMTANRLDSTSAAQAMDQLSTDEARNFARKMISEHGAMMDAIRAESSRLGVTPAANEVSSTLEEMATQRIDANGANADRAYMENEVVMHQQVLSTIDEVLLPQASDPTLRALVQRMRTLVSAHLQDAESIRTRLATR